MPGLRTANLNLGSFPQRRTGLESPALQTEEDVKSEERTAAMADAAVDLVCGGLWCRRGGPAGPEGRIFPDGCRFPPGRPT
jgi:hypothetical protein